MPDKQPGKLDLGSMDIAARKLSELKILFPEAFTETRKDDRTIVEAIDFERLKAAFGEFSNILERQKERYGMVWPGKNECQKIIQQPSLATLKPDRDESVNFDETQNLFIEGDNLEVLKLLQKSYYGKVKMIYIDPPYNTGKDFVYPDNYSETLETYLRYARLTNEKGRKWESMVNSKDSGRFHAQWLNMMYPRLYLARNLLDDDGVIFISIDDNEVSNLSALCDIVFGQENFLNQIVVENDSRARPYGSVATTHEYILVYAKNESFIYEELIDPHKNFKNKDDEGGFDLYELRNRNIAFNINNRPNLYYPFYVNENVCDENSLYRISLSREDGWKEVYPAKSQGVQTVWRWGQHKAQQNLNSVLFAQEAENEYGYKIVKKYRERSVTLNSVWSGKDIKTDKGTLETKSIFDNRKVFDFPKPTALIKKLIAIASPEGSIMLDFFSGSCSSAHAILDFNKEDGGNRKFIMVQLPEPCPKSSEATKAGFNTIADIGKERIRRVIKEIESEQEGMLDLDIKPKQDLGFKVFKLDRSNFKVWDSDPKEDTKTIKKQIKLHIDHIDANASQEDILYELLLKAGFPLTTKIEKQRIADKDVFAIEDGALLICLEKSLTPELIRAMADANPLQVICLDEGFEGNDQLKTNAAQTFKSRSQGESEHQQIVFRTV